jgi:hypothetical protein
MLYLLFVSSLLISVLYLLFVSSLLISVLYLLFVSSLLISMLYLLFAGSLSISCVQCTSIGDPLCAMGLVPPTKCTNPAKACLTYIGKIPAPGNY